VHAQKGLSPSDQVTSDKDDEQFHRINGKFKGEDVLLPRIRMIPKDMSFEFKRLQCATHFCNDHQQSIKKIVDTQVCGLNLKNPCFSHGQLYGLAHALENFIRVYTNKSEGKTKIVYIQKLFKKHN
jgi:ATP-dependent DNA helicase PIF1